MQYASMKNPYDSICDATKKMCLKTILGFVFGGVGASTWRMRVRNENRCERIEITIQQLDKMFIVLQYTHPDNKKGSTKNPSMENIYTI